MESSELAQHTDFLGNIGLYSYGTALVAFVLLTAFAIFTRRNNPMGNLLLCASALTAVWAGSVVVSSLMPAPQRELMQATEIARNAGWTFALLRLLVLRMQCYDEAFPQRRWFTLLAVFYVVALSALPMSDWLAAELSLQDSTAASITFSTWLAMALIGLLLLEQYFRNSNENELWATKHLCIGLGILFAYDFFMYAEALLFQNMDRNLWQARGVVITMAALLAAISMGRTERSYDQETPRSVYLSRHVVFHSLTLMASGIYLISMALAAYFIRYLGGSWGGVLQITFLCAAGLTLVVLLFSGKIRASARVWLSKNFFSYKYDYRTEWLQFTRKLATDSSEVPMRITQAIADLAKSPAGVLWGRSNGDRLSVLAHWETPHPGAHTDLGDLTAWLQQSQWIIDLHEWRRAPDMYNNLMIPRSLTDIPKAWLIIPLLFGDRLQGILLLKESELVHDLNWEDRDLLKVAGRQAASHLAQFQADQALMESRQFEAFNRLSAYVIHDLKNILAQLSLMVSNAEKHKDNPAFIDDMVDTVNNSVQRMTKLMAQLRSETSVAGTTEHSEVELGELLREVVRESGVREPAPTLEVDGSSFLISCDRERLHAVFGHLIHNAQDATGKQGKVTVRLRGQCENVIVEIQDNGEGMSEQFIQQRLFKPFDSTKGLTGMGIGAFESRDFVRSLGGDISVDSTPGQGSVFQVRIPGDRRNRADSPATTQSASLLKQA